MDRLWNSQLGTQLWTTNYHGHQRIAASFILNFWLQPTRPTVPGKLQNQILADQDTSYANQYILSLLDSFFLRPIIRSTIRNHRLHHHCFHLFFQFSNKHAHRDPLLFRTVYRKPLTNQINLHPFVSIRFCNLRITPSKYPWNNHQIQYHNHFFLCNVPCK